MDVPTPLDAPTNCRGVGEILNRVGDKWTMQVVVALRDQPLRFNEIKRQVAGISQQMLTLTLKALELDGMVERNVRATMPPQSLSDPVRQLAQWVGKHLASIHENRLRYDEKR